MLRTGTKAQVETQKANREAKTSIPYLDGPICKAEFSELGSGVAGGVSASLVLCSKGLARILQDRQIWGEAKD